MIFIIYEINHKIIVKNFRHHMAKEQTPNFKESSSKVLSTSPDISNNNVVA